MDNHGNPSSAPASPFPVVLDRTPPALSSATFQARVNPTSGAKTGTVVVTWDGPLASGRDSAADWDVEGTVNGSAVSFTVASVAATSNTTRTLTIDPNDPNFFACGMKVTSVSYTFEPSLPGSPYTDPAGNHTTSTQTQQATGSAAC
jgi:hypothetical protein